MKKINVLDKHTAQVIAAGEVVERPSAVVKELVENSIDAGASRISVEIKNGGIKLIKISDNGSGIYRDDVKNAFFRHATSKLKYSEDLNSVISLGFRGEALASVCAVSKTEIITKSPEEDMGTQFFVNGGSQGKLSDIGCCNGTTIFVRDLFYNTPARMKFLKKDTTESNCCAGVVDKLALSHPDIAFKFIRDGKVTLQTAGDGKISSAIYCVYGKEFIDGMIPIDYEFEKIKISGFVSKPEFSKSNRSMQHFFVNKRYVKIGVGSSALEQAYKNNIMVGKFPYCVIYIDIDPKFTDVNVHPAKTEIKFTDEKIVFEAIYYAVKTAFMSNNQKNSISNIFDDLHDDDKKSSQNFLNHVANEGVNKSIFCNNQKNFSEEKDSEIVFNDFFSVVRPINNVLRGTHDNTKKYDSEKIIEKQDEKDEPNKQSEQGKQGTQNDRVDFYQNANLKNEIQKDKIEKITDSVEVEVVDFEKYFSKNKEMSDIDFNIVGEIFDCYIIIQLGEEVILVDKHAAHERLIFEKLKKSPNTLQSQTLITPVTFAIEKERYDAVLENKSLFLDVGIEIEDFGPGFLSVRGIPMYMDISEVKNSVEEISEYIIKNKSDINTEKLDWIYHNIACRSAVKAGDKTSKEEIAELVKKLLCNPDVTHCPHGRPIYVKWNKKFVEKQFKRT